MGETFVAMAGTKEGEVLAFFLALMSALAHAIFAAVNKGGVDPYLNRGAINVAYSLMAAPFALFVFPLPEGFLIPVLALSFFLHIGYEWLQAGAFSRGAFTLVYPIARGIGPLVTALFALIVFSESLAATQWFGLILLSGAIISLAGVNMIEKDLASETRHNLSVSIMLAIGAGVFVALYTTADAYGIRLTANPFTFLAWFFFLGGFGFPFIAAHRYLKMADRPALPPLAVRGIFGALIAFFSFGSLMLATRIGKVSEAAALRETSIIFATGIGVLFFHERVDLKRLAIIGLIAAGAILIEVH
ncbi:MAG: EamA family transporter [Rhizobiaceae bacterium]|jgi:drug/metabolite transporter (DMT)-like permease|nr:EamA family transporter [Rhizobiaceae bacterium]